MKWNLLTMAMCVGAYALPSRTPFARIADVVLLVQVGALAALSIMEWRARMP